MSDDRLDDDGGTSYTIEFTLNGDSIQTEVPSNLTLVELLRDNFGKTGTVEGCGVGVCGCCTVLADGEPVTSCLALAINVDGATLETVEGLADRHPEAGVHPLQRAFIQTDALQCGYCTPGMLMSAEALLRTDDNPDRETIMNYLSENICRCTGYESIIDAVERAAREIRD